MLEKIAIFITAMMLGMVALLALLMVISFFNSALMVFYPQFLITSIILLILSHGMVICGENGVFT